MHKFLLALALAPGLLCAPARSATYTVPGTVVPVPLDVSIVAIGGVAVTALNAGHRTAGGWLFNPATAAVALCISETGAASGSVSAGPTTCIAPGTVYTLAPSIAPVSVVSSDALHPFSGLGWTS